MRRRPKGLLKAVLLLVVCAVFLAGILIAVRLFDDSHYVETRGNPTEGFGELKTVEYGGATWRQKPAVTTILVAGIDKTDSSSQSRLSASQYRQGGQADFLTLLAIDHTDRKIHRLSIDRDTMTEVSILGVFGNETGSRVLQICLAHYFGKTPEDNAYYTVRAVERYLDGLEIDGYYMADYSAVPVLADALDGVEVIIPEDMTAVDTEWIAGSAVTLRGAKAETFVRTRKTVGDGSNASRMSRQTLFLDSVTPKLRSRLSENLSFATELLDALDPYATSNLTRARLVNEINQSYAYEILPADTLPGEHTLGEDGFIEFHPEEGAAVRWVLEHLYQKMPEDEK